MLECLEHNVWLKTNQSCSEWFEDMILIFLNFQFKGSLKFVHSAGFLVSWDGLVGGGFFDGFGFVFDFFEVFKGLFESIVGL